MLSCITPNPLLNHHTNPFAARFFSGVCKITMTCQAELHAATLI